MVFCVLAGFAPFLQRILMEHQLLRRWHFDFTFPAAYVAHSVANVPMPGCSRSTKLTSSAAAARPPKAAASAADSTGRRSEDKKGR